MTREGSLTSSGDALSGNVKDSVIYEEIVLNALKIGDNYRMIAEVLLQTILDFARILSHLSRAKSMDIISPQVYNNIVQECLLMLNESKENVTFNPLHYTD